MNKKQSISGKLNNPFYFLTLALIIISLCFVFFTPKVTSSLFPFRRDMVFNSFLQNTRKTNVIDPQKYWEFREFYSPGYFDVSTKGIDLQKINTTLRELNASPTNISVYFSKFNSRHLVSLEGLTKNSFLSEVFNKNKTDIKKVLFENSTSIIYKNNQNQTYVIFILPISEMEKANGFFDYNSKDKDLLKDMNWFNIAKLDR